MFEDKLNYDITDWSKESGFKIINMSDKAISFRLDAYSCYKVKTGVCSLELTDLEVSNRSEREVAEQCVQVTKCPSIFQDMQSKGKFDSLYVCSGDEPKLIKMMCGHYECSGQHRICVAKHKNMLFPFSPNAFEESTEKCGACKNEDGYVLVR